MKNANVQNATKPKFMPSNDVEISSRPTEKISIGSVIYIRYRDHVLFHMAEPITMSPQTRECLGWLVDQRPDYVIISWDRNCEPPTLKGGDSKAGGLVILSSDILEMRKV